MSKKKALTAGQIFDMWMKEAQDGLSSLGTKTFDPGVYTDQRPRAIAKIQAMFAAGLTFGPEEEKGSKKVAHDVGKICRLLNVGDKVVKNDLFDKVRKLCARNHNRCKLFSTATGGWCDY